MLRRRHKNSIDVYLETQNVYLLSAWHGMFFIKSAVWHGWSWKNGRWMRGCSCYQIENKPGYKTRNCSSSIKKIQSRYTMESRLPDSIPNKLIRRIVVPRLAMNPDLEVSQRSRSSHGTNRKGLSRWSCMPNIKCFIIYIMLQKMSSRLKFLWQMDRRMSFNVLGFCERQGTMNQVFIIHL